MGTLVRQAGCAVALLCVTLWAPNAYAYPSYDDGTGVGCVQCHNGYRTLDLAALNATLRASAKPQCVDCHGEHRLAIRTRRWDKATGKLVHDDGVRMTSKSGMKKGDMQ